MEKSDYAMKVIRRHMPENQATYERMIAKSMETSILMTTGVILITSIGKLKIGMPMVLGLASYELAKAYQSATQLAEYGAQINDDNSHKTYKKTYK